MTLWNQCQWWTGTELDSLERNHRSLVPAKQTKTFSYIHVINILTLLHSERPKLHMNLGFLSAIGLYSQFVFILQWFKSCIISCTYLYISSHRFLKIIKKAISQQLIPGYSIYYMLKYGIFQVTTLKEKTKWQGDYEGL